jgi:hypothetical protein
MAMIKKVGIIILMATTVSTDLEGLNKAGKKIINQYCDNVSGYGIPKDDEAHIIQCGGAPTYGEITLDAAEKLITYLKPTEKDVFVDAGSGVGKLVTQFFFSSPIRKSIGIELSKQRFKKAMNIKEALKKDNKVPTDRTLEFYNQNILDADFNDATIFFMCSTCFSKDLMQKITDKLSHLKSGLRVVTLKQLPGNKKFKLIHQMNLNMTWSKKTTVYIYELL